jgi:uncharacterized phage protein (TIGR01671 family)
MSREIKFRAWDESQKYMAYQGTPDLETIQSFFHHFGDKTLMQFTGLKDINGKDIWEGDILSFTKNNSFANKPIAVKFSGSSFVVYNPNCCTVCKNSGGCISNLDECLALSGCAEVIGNIYENKELL